MKFPIAVLTVFTLLCSFSTTTFAQMTDTLKPPIAAPPIAKTIPKTDTTHGDVRTDNYFWLRDKTNTEVIKHLEAENAYTEGMMQDTKPLQEKLYNEMKGRIKETDVSVPYKEHGYSYYSRTEEGKQYPAYYRVKGTLKADMKIPKANTETVTLDLNKLAEGKTFLRLGAYRVSPDTKLLAYGLDYEGSRKFAVYVKNLETGALMKDEIPVTGGALAWANDNKTLFYDVYDESLRSYKIMRHILGTPAASDVEVFHEKDEKFDCYIGKTRSDAYLIIVTTSKLTRECWFLDANTPKGTFRCIEPRRENHEYAVEHHGKNFVILTNDNAKNFRIMETPVAKPGMANWKEVVKHRPEVKIEDIDVFKNFYALSERTAGLTVIELYDVKSKNFHTIAFPETAYDCSLYANLDYNSDTLRYTYTSPVTPNSVYDYDTKSRTSVLLKQQEVPTYDPTKYTAERVFVKAADGTQIPLTIVYKKGVKKDGSNPTWLYGYGSYGISIDPGFSSWRVSLLDRGFVYAVAHPRGGGEMGREWYENGKFLTKKNTFTDFIACAEYLIAEKYTTNQKLVAQGASAGGLLMGAVLNMRPDLFKAVHAGVPFVDVINTMLDASLPLTTSEYEEWGDPNDKKFYDYMKSYSPYDNVKQQAYPNVLFTCGLNDTQVPYWEPAKFLAKLRTMKTDNNMMLFKIDMGVGHGGASGRYDSLKEDAFETAFMLKVLGITQ
jgi:oligopeptidase B